MKNAHGLCEISLPNARICEMPRTAREFCENFANSRMVEESRLLSHIANLGDLQVSWLFLYMCAVPRANHILRQLPPSISKIYAKLHDTAISACLESLLQIPNACRDRTVQGIASIPQIFGGLGLRSAVRTAEPAYWAAWADALPILLERLPEYARLWVAQLTEAESCSDFPLGSLPACLKEAEVARRKLQLEAASVRNVWKLPSWAEIAAGKRPPL